MNLTERAAQVRRDTLRVHGRFPETRIASSLSAVEIFTALFYGDVMRFDANDVNDPGRDRLVVSKGHGAIAMYPILADLGFFDRDELERIGKPGSFLGGIPDPVIPGFETVNGSLGHGLGVACGIALALKRARSDRNVIVVMGDGELYEGSVWEAVMFAAHHSLDNMTLVIDNNKLCMLGRCDTVLNLEPLEHRFGGFGWDTHRIDGHDITALRDLFASVLPGRAGRPSVIIADTVKGKGVPSLEQDMLSHIRSLRPEDVEAIIGGSL